MTPTPNPPVPPQPEPQSELAKASPEAMAAAKRLRNAALLSLNGSSAEPSKDLALVFGAMDQYEVENKLLKYQLENANKLVNAMTAQLAQSERELAEAKEKHRLATEFADEVERINKSLRGLVGELAEHLTYQYSKHDWKHEDVDDVLRRAALAPTPINATRHDTSARAGMAEELAADKERLDWIEQNGIAPSKNKEGLFMQVVHTGTDTAGNISIYTHKTARGVIDKVRYAALPKGRL